MTDTHSMTGHGAPAISLQGVSRWLMACCAAFAVTIGLFLFMRFLVHVEFVALPEPVERTDIVIHEYVEVLHPAPRVYPEPIEHQAPPPSPTFENNRESVPSETSFTTVERPNVTTPVELGGAVLAAIAPPPIQVRTSPVYPESERRRGITGQCTVRYDVLASGRTANLQVTQCDSAGFARATLNAIQDWQHAAYTDRDPDQVVSRGLETTLVYELNGE